MKSQKIRTHLDTTYLWNQSAELVGWFDGEETVLGIKFDGKFIGSLSSQRLYRLAKAIVRHMEGDK